MGLRWLCVLALCLAMPSAGFAGEQSGVLRRISCPVVRYYVAQYSASAAEQWARAQGCAELASDALLDNHASHRFHAGAGFEETERVVYFRKRLEER